MHHLSIFYAASPSFPHSKLVFLLELDANEEIQANVKERRREAMRTTGTGVSEPWKASERESAFFSTGLLSWRCGVVFVAAIFCDLQPPPAAMVRPHSCDHLLARRKFCFIFIFSFSWRSLQCFWRCFWRCAFFVSDDDSSVFAVL